MRSRTKLAPILTGALLATGCGAGAGVGDLTVTSRSAATVVGHPAAAQATTSAVTRTRP